MSSMGLRGGRVRFKAGCPRQDRSGYAAVTNKPPKLSNLTKQTLISCSYKVHGEFGRLSRAAVLYIASQ